METWFNFSPEFRAQLQIALSDPRIVAEGLFRTVKLFVFHPRDRHGGA